MNLKNAKIYRWIIIVLFIFSVIATIALLISSLSHIAKAFQAFESKKLASIGWYIGIGIEVFMLLSAFSRLIATKEDEKNFFNNALKYYTSIILAANIYYTFTVIVGHDILQWSDISGGEGWKNYLNIDPVKLIFIFIFSPTLPISAIIGTKIIQTFGENIGTANRRIENILKKIADTEEIKPVPSVATATEPTPDFAPVYDPDASEKQPQPGE